MAAFMAERFGIKETGQTAFVPNNSTAKLMYYLRSVTSVLQLENPNLRRLTDYGNYNSLTDREVDALLSLVILFSPDELLGKVFFHSENCGGSNNQFFELSAVSHMLAVSDNILIGGERKRVAKVMFFKRKWMDDNYFSPLRSFQGHLQRIALGLPGRAPTPPLPPPSPWPAPTTRLESNVCNIL